MKREYISVSGKPIIYEYKNYKKSKMKTKPKCLKCGIKLRYITTKIIGNYLHLGYYCLECEILFIYDKYKKIIHIKQSKK